MKYWRVFDAINSINYFISLRIILLIAYTKKYLQSYWLSGVQYWPSLYSVFNICTLCWLNKKKKIQQSNSVVEIEMYSLKRTVIAHLCRTSYRTFISHNMANIFLVSHILLLFHSPKGSWYKLAKYEKLGKYWSYCTQNRAITNASCTQYRTVQDYSNSNLHSLNTIFSWKK